MEQKRASLEIIAPSVEEALERGLADLGLTESEVEVEILDSGSKGLFGLGFRQARIRLTIKSAAPQGASPQPTSASIETPQVIPAAPQSPKEKPQAEKSQVAKPPAVKQAGSSQAVEQSGSRSEAEKFVPTATRVAEAPESGDEAELPVDEEVQELDEHLLSVAHDTVQELLDKMKIKAHLTTRFGEPDDPNDRIPLLVDIRGDDLSILIGPRAETLNALQYISSLIIGKEVGHSIPLVIDVEGFRARRSQQIRQLARRMAEQAVRTGRRQVLEPMPASERRLIHIELREHPDVTTESIGEEPRRKVTINPK